MTPGRDAEHGLKKAVQDSDTKGNEVLGMLMNMIKHSTQIIQNPCYMIGNWKQEGKGTCYPDLGHPQPTARGSSLLPSRLNNTPVILTSGFQVETYINTLEFLPLVV